MTTSNRQSVPHLDLSVLSLTDRRGRNRNIAQITVEEWKRERHHRYVEQCVLCGEPCVIRDNRINWNIKDSDGDTPIMYCLKTNKMEMFRLLLNNPRVDLNTRDRDGKYLEDIARYKVLID